MSILVDRKIMLYMLLLFPIMKPTYFSHIAWLNPIYQIMLLFTLGYCVLLYLRRRKIPAGYVWLFMLLEDWLYCITYINHGDLPEVGRICRGVLGFAFIFDLFSENADDILKCLNKYFMFFVSLNLLLMIVVPQGIYAAYSSVYTTHTEEWLLGVGNVAISWHFPAVIVAWMYSKMVHNNKYGWYMSAIVLISNLIDGSATAIVGVLVILIIQNINSIKGILTPKMGALIAIVFFLVIVVYQSFEFLQPIVVGFLGKDMTFTGRLMIWSNAISGIVQKPIFGHGVMYTKEITKILGVVPDIDFIWEGATHCHDNYLQIAFTGGLIAVLIYYFIYRIAIRKLTIYWNNPISKACTAGLIAFLVIQISEVFDYSILMYLAIFLPLNIDNLIHAVNSKENR